MTSFLLTALAAIDRSKRAPGRLMRSARYGAGLIVLVLFSACSDSSPRSSYELAAQGIYTGSLSADGQYALIGSLNHGASLWRTDHERLYNWSHEAGEVTDLVATGFSPDGSQAVTTDPRTLVVWDTASGAGLAYWTTPAAVMDVTLLPAGRGVLMGLKDHSAVVFDAESGDHLHTMLHEGVVGSVAVDAQGRFALTGSDDETARLWNLADGELLQTFTHDNPVRVVALSDSGDRAFSAAQNRQVVIWDTATGLALHTLSERNNGITAARFSPDEQLLLIGFVNRRVELWNVQQGKLIDSWDTKSRKPMHATGAAILAVGFRSNRQFYALAGDGRLVELIPG